MLQAASLGMTLKLFAYLSFASTSYRHPLTKGQAMPAEATGIVQIINEVGVVTAALAFSAWLVVYLLKGFERERTQWLTKDDLADQELRLLMKESNQALTGVLKETNSTLLEMKIAITKLEESINKGTR